MKLIDKICQLFVITVDDYMLLYDEEQMDYITHVGGVIYFDHQGDTVDDLKRMIGIVKKQTPDSLICVDEEGGRVSRLAGILGKEFESPFLFRDKGERYAYDHAYQIGEMLRGIGFNLNFAPVADVWSNKENTVIGDRAYSDSFEEAASMVSAAVQGFHKSGVLSTIKHWPGHGSTVEDSHKQAAYVYKKITDMIDTEIKPFRAGIKAGANLVMTGHISVPEFDTKPASLSQKWIDYLRYDLGFGGVIITDSLKMKALTNLYSEDELALQSLIAGNDMALMPLNYVESVKVIIQAVESGLISEGFIDSKLKRVNRIKQLLR